MYKAYVSVFKIQYYSMQEIAKLLSTALIGLIPAYFAMDKLSELSGLANRIENTYALWFVLGTFSLILEVLGLSILKQATEVFLAKYQNYTAEISLVCGVIYVINMMLLTVAYLFLPEGYERVSIGFLCFMPVVAYISSAIQEVKDKETLNDSADREYRRKREEEIENRKMDEAFQLKLLKARSATVPQTVPSEQDRNDFTVGTPLPEQIMERFQNKGIVSYGTLADELGVGKTTIKRAIDKLVNDKHLHKEGSTISLNGYHT